jgi:integrase/recombinase XerD
MRVSDGLNQYLVRRRATGMIYERPEALLQGFCLHVGDLRFDELEAHHVKTFLDEPHTSAGTWRLKYRMLLKFLEFWFHRGAMPRLHMPLPKPLEAQTFVPYVYSRAELRSLLKATVQNEHEIRAIDRQTLRTFILFLYGTGARVGEVLFLKHRDVHLESRLITVRRANSTRSRTIPIGPDLAEVLRKYLLWRSRKAFQSDRLFVTRYDSPVSRGIVTVNFQRLRSIAKVFRGDATHQQPRLDDLRYTFAVHRITSWIREGADLDRMLPAMATYMGQVGLGATERYLAMTPERFRQSLNKLSPAHNRNKWRNDAMLMDYIAGL